MVDILLVSVAILADKDIWWAIDLFDLMLILNETLYILIVYQWLICVDYSLYHSKDHLRRRYRFAWIPIVAVTALEILRDLSYLNLISLPGLKELDHHVFYILKLIIEAWYIITAVIMVIRYEKDRREPRFLRLTAFIIPFVLGVLFRFFDAPFAALGVILTYLAMKRRDRFIDYGTGLYKDSYLDYISTLWDKKGITDANIILLSAKGHEAALAGILKEISIQDCFIITFGEGRFAILTGGLRNSAVWMTEQMITEAAKETDSPFEVEMQSLSRGKGQSMKEFVTETRKIIEREG